MRRHRRGHARSTDGYCELPFGRGPDQNARAAPVTPRTPPSIAWAVLAEGAVRPSSANASNGRAPRTRTVRELVPASHSISWLCAASLGLAGLAAVRVVIASRHPTVYQTHPCDGRPGLRAPDTRA
jgi:hypothetical protein